MTSYVNSATGSPEFPPPSVGLNGIRKRRTGRAVKPVMTSPQINGDPPTEGPAEDQLLAEAFAEDVARAASFAEADAAAATEQPTGPPPADLTASP